MSKKSNQGVSQGKKRIMITVSSKLIDELEADTQKRGLNLSKSARIELALEHELHAHNRDDE